METRIQRYKKYRAELIKEGSDVAIKEKPMTATTALPIKEVIDMAEEEKRNRSFYKRQQAEKLIKYILLVLLLITCVVGIIIFGVYVFGGNK